MDIASLNALHFNKTMDGAAALANDVQLYRFMRARHAEITVWLKFSYIRITRVKQQIQARLEHDRGGIPYSHITKHPAARDEKESWRSLPSQYNGPRTTPQDYSVFVEKFVDAASVEVTMMANAIADPLEDIYMATVDRLPSDDHPESREKCERQIRIESQASLKAAIHDEEKVDNFISSATLCLHNLLGDISKLLQNTASVYHQVHDALKIGQQSDAIFDQRPQDQQAAVIRQLIKRALDDKVPNHQNPLRSERLWSTVAYTPVKPYFDILAAELHRITVARTSIARLLRHGIHISNFVAEEDARRDEERAAFQSADAARHLFMITLEPVILPEGGTRRECEGIAVDRT